jgi:solute carrier family 35 (adenosine 3'-phospho 5'-phosphosulfate transporter), member B3
MIVASIVHRKVFTSMEYFCAFCVCLGLVLFAAADWNLRPSFHPIGLAFVSLSVCADAILPNAQERLFQLGSSRLEVTCEFWIGIVSWPICNLFDTVDPHCQCFRVVEVFSNIFTLIAMTITTLLSGDLLGTIAFAQTNTLLCHYIVIYTFVAYIAISVHMNVVRRFGGVAAVLLATGRKGMTLVLSFVLFPKAFSWYYVMGAVLVLGGLLLSSMVKFKSKKKQSFSPHKNRIDVEEMELLLSGDNHSTNRPSPPYDVENIDHIGNHQLQDGEMKDRLKSIRSSNNGGAFFSRIHSHQQ